jgi:hypothetical protein
MFKVKMMHIKIKKFIIRYHFYISFIIVFIYLAPFLILWEKTPVPINDNLDSNVIYWKILSKNGNAFADNSAIIPDMMNGLPRSSYGSQFQVIVLLFYIFPPYLAYVINEFLIHIFAFLGMYLLLKNHFKINHNELVNIAIIDGVSLCYAFLPFWSPGGLSIAGLPLTLYAFLNIRFDKSTKKDLIILTFVPFYSSLLFSFVFFFVIIFLTFLKDCASKHIFNRKFFLALVYFGLLYIFIEYRLIISQFIDNSYCSHRSDFKSQKINFSDSVWRSINHFFKGHYHSESLHTFFMVYCISTTVISSIMLEIFGNEDFEKIKPKISLLIKTLILSGVISVIYGFKPWNKLSFIYNKYPILKSFQWDRFYTLSPLIWYIILAISLDISFFYVKNLKVMQKTLIKHFNKNSRITHIKFGKLINILLISLICFQGIYNCSNNLVYNSIYNKIVYDENYISYSEYYAEEQFNEIKSDIKKPIDDYRIGCIGFDPAVAIYNGFYTIDGYHVNYPLEYKYRFRHLISKELEKNTKHRYRFDDWGSRCYIFVDELDEDFNTMYKWKNKPIENLELNVTALKDLEVRFIFSSVEINNYQENNLTKFNTYNHKDSIWKIYVYRVRVESGAAT